MQFKGNTFALNYRFHNLYPSIRTPLPTQTKIHCVLGSGDKNEPVWEEFEGERKEELRCACARDERPSNPPRFQGSQTRSEFKLERSLASNRGYYFLQHCESAFYAFTVPECLAIETIKCKNFWYDARGISLGKLG